MNKGRRRSDGGSAVLESNMNKMKGYEQGGSKNVPLPKKKPSEPLHQGRRQPEEEKTFKLTEEEEREMTGSTLSDYRKSMEEKAMGGTMKAKGYAGGGSCRGGDAAIQGTKFSGEY